MVECMSMAKNTNCLAEIIKITVKIRFCCFREKIGIIDQVKKTRKLQSSCFPGETSYCFLFCSIQQPAGECLDRGMLLVSSCIAFLAITGSSVCAP